MSLLKIAAFRLAQDNKSGFFSFKVIKPDGSVSEWVGKEWLPIPFTQFSCLVSILTTGNAYYDDKNNFFVANSNQLQSTESKNVSAKEKIDLGEKSLSVLITQRKRKATSKSKKSRKP